MTGQNQFLAWMVNHLSAFLSNEIDALHAAIDDPGGWNGANFAAPASVFVVLYLLAFVWFFWATVKIRDQVYFILTFFCSIRIASFTIRTILGRLNYNHKDALPSLLAAQDILNNAGFFALLYPAYIIVLKLEHFFQLCTGQPPTPVLQPLRNRSLFRLGHFISVTLRLMATSRVHYHSRHEWSPSTTYALDEASNVAFLILTAVLVLLALNYVRVNLVARPQLHHDDSTSSASSTITSSSSSSAISQTTASRSHNRYPAFIILSISFLLLLRQSFATAVSSLSKKPNHIGHEYLWYLLIATPEILAIVLFSYPGLVPHWREPRIHDVERSDSDSDTPSCSGNCDAREAI